MELKSCQTVAKCRTFYWKFDGENIMTQTEGEKMAHKWSLKYDEKAQETAWKNVIQCNGIGVIELGGKLCANQASQGARIAGIMVQSGIWGYSGSRIYSNLKTAKDCKSKFQEFCKTL